jgi:hypothetical protein
MLVAPTQFLRVTVQDSFREVLAPCSFACERRVVAIVPEGPTLFFDLDKSPEDVGPDRTYKAPPFEGGKPIPFALQPHQRMIAAAERGIVTFTLIIEHHALKDG